MDILSGKAKASAKSGVAQPETLSLRAAAATRWLHHVAQKLEQKEKASYDLQADCVLRAS